MEKMLMSRFETLKMKMLMSLMSDVYLIKGNLNSLTDIKSIYFQSNYACAAFLLATKWSA